MRRLIFILGNNFALACNLASLLEPTKLSSNSKVHPSLTECAWSKLTMEFFSQWKFAFLSLGRPDYLQDSDIVSSRFQVHKSLSHGRYEHTSMLILALRHLVEVVNILFF